MADFWMYKLVTAAAVVIGIGQAGSALAAPVVGTFSDLVNATVNLFNGNWGHSYTAPVPGGYSSNTSNLDTIGVGTGQAPRAFQMAPSVPLAFTPGQDITIDVPRWSWVVDLNIHGTDAFGVPEDDALATDNAFKQLYGFNFRGLRVYSLIAMWSTSATSIVPFVPASNPGFDTLPFLVGYGLDLAVPDSTGPLFLFFGDNDGYFADNESAYDVSISLRAVDGPAVAAVPAPATLALLASALLMPLVLRRRRKIDPASVFAGF